MAKISFNIKHRQKIESGEYKVETDAGCPARIVCWDVDGNLPILALITLNDEKFEEAAKFFEDGTNFFNDPLYSKLIIITPEPELSEFENRLRSCIIENFTTSTKDGNGNELSCTVFIDDNNAKKLASDILYLAREEIEKEKKSSVVEKLREISNPSDEDWFEIQKQWEKEDDGEEYVKRFRSLCDAYEIKLPNREYDIYHLCNDLSKLFTGSDKQKSVEWSEEDRRMIQSIITNGCVDDKQEHWLRLLPERICLTKQKLSDEDEKRIKQLIYDTEHIRAEYEKRKRELGERFNDNLIKDCNDQIAWLKDLLRKEVGKEKPAEWSNKDATKFGNLEYERGVKDGMQSEKNRQWKPSEEQMKHLERCFSHGHTSQLPNQNVLESLYRDLQKLL